MFKYVFPTDPDCPAVQSYFSSHAEDPISIASGCMGEFMEAFEKKHMGVCKRCQSYSAEHVDVEETEYYL